MNNQIAFLESSKKTIHLDLFVDESKNRKYISGNIKQNINYIMILAIPTEKKEELYNELNSARCLNENNKDFGKCINKCNYHDENNGELHYTKIQKKNIKYKIIDKWIDILLNNNFNNKKNIYFNILGIIESNIDMSLFGKNKQYANMYSRFFRTNLLRLLSMFSSYDKVIIDNIYHDGTHEMESHEYFDTNSIKKIRMKEFLKEEKKIVFNTDKIEFIDSDHRVGKEIDSQFIQFVDIILGLTCNVIHNDAENQAKIDLTKKIYPLIYRILDKKTCCNKNSSYNYFNKQVIGFFPNVSKEELKKKYLEIYGEEKNIDDFLNKPYLFDNTKKILFKNGCYDQITLFDI